MLRECFPRGCQRHVSNKLLKTMHVAVAPCSASSGSAWHSRAYLIATFIIVGVRSYLGMLACTCLSGLGADRTRPITHGSKSCGLQHNVTREHRWHHSNCSRSLHSLGNFRCGGERTWCWQMPFIYDRQAPHICSPFFVGPTLP